MIDELKKYTPNDLEEAVTAIDIITEESSDKIAWINSEENDALAEAHHSLGQNIRNAWGLWDENSVLHLWFKENGIWHPDDMSSIILTCFHREKNGKKWKLKKQIKFYKKFWKNNK